MTTKPKQPDPAPLANGTAAGQSGLASPWTGGPWGSQLTSIARQMSQEGAVHLAADDELEQLAKYVGDWHDAISAELSERPQRRANAAARREAKARRDQNRQRLRAIVSEIAPTMQCNCDLDNWEPEPDTGHSHVCRIHKAAKQRI